MARSSYLEDLAGLAVGPDRVGGKGASLARLVALGHRVPPGFVLTVDALSDTIDQLGLRDAVRAIAAALTSGSGDLLGPGRIVQESLLGGRIPQSILAPILEHVGVLRLFEDGSDGVIARSSATVEDSAMFSFAGIFESIPVTLEADLEAAIREVWASVFSPRALSYVKEGGLTAVPDMAVVVQRFLEATRSGVMFTEFTSPDGSTRILVEHVEGGCEKLVKGEVTPDRLWLESPDLVSDDLDGLLTPNHARELARLAGDLQEMFGAPQDVEWVIYDEAVHLVQSRPITVGVVSPASAPTVRAEGLAPVLSGVAASPGVGAGDVHLVFNIQQALSLARGQVLVTPMTNPDMVVAMRNSAGIVTDVGGMICHAAIVSRELGLPCVVGTESATVTLEAGDPVTVDGSRGVVYRGIQAIERPAEESALTAGWEDVWTAWTAPGAGRSDLTPVVSSVGALEAAPPGIDRIILVPDVDLRADHYGVWNDLEGLPEADAGVVLDDYVRAVSEANPGGVARVEIQPAGSLPVAGLAQAVARRGDPRVVIGECGPSDLGQPLTGALLVPRVAPGRGVDESLSKALDTLTFFGHRPGVKVTSMPFPEARRTWWALLPEYGRYHYEFGTEREAGSFEWLEVRPELVISALLKSLVQPGFEMVPRILGFPELPPMHIKWVKCRYHFRADTFARVWEAVVRHTYDEAWMVDLMRRVRASYRYLEEILRLFPQTDQDLATIPCDRIVALITAWWPRWVEFFSLCWFIQAQGDDVAYPFVEETIADNLASIGPPPQGKAWPRAADLIAPTTPVMSGEYMADVGKLREALMKAGLTTSNAAMAAMAAGSHPEVATLVERHLERWHWMRDRDLLFEPWDTPARVIETALKTGPHTVTHYAENLRRNLFALSFHVDLAHRTGRAGALRHHARFLHDLNVERENHHILWLKYSYPLRQLVLEVERRLVGAGSLRPGDVFFLQAPELIEAAGRLPAPLPPELVDTVRNRRAGYLTEARLAPAGTPAPFDEDDYY